METEMWNSNWVIQRTSTVKTSISLSHLQTEGFSFHFWLLIDSFIQFSCSSNIR
jgi:hypothetical protein